MWYSKENDANIITNSKGSGATVGYAIDGLTERPA